jgi:splicing factor 1
VPPAPPAKAGVAKFPGCPPFAITVDANELAPPAVIENPVAIPPSPHVIVYVVPAVTAMLALYANAPPPPPPPPVYAPAPPPPIHTAETVVYPLGAVNVNTPGVPV